MINEEKRTDIISKLDNGQDHLLTEEQIRETLPNTRSSGDGISSFIEGYAVIKKDKQLLIVGTLKITEFNPESEFNVTFFSDEYPKNELLYCSVIAVHQWEGYQR